MTTKPELDLLKRWLVDPDVIIDLFDHQDSVWYIASAFPCSALIDLYRIQGALPNRRDEILYAIAVNLQMLLDPHEQCDAQMQSERELTVEFSKENWGDILRIDREMGLSGDFDSYVVPFMSKTYSIARKSHSENAKP